MSCLGLGCGVTVTPVEVIWSEDRYDFEEINRVVENLRRGEGDAALRQAITQVFEDIADESVVIFGAELVPPESLNLQLITQDPQRDHRAVYRTSVHRLGEVLGVFAANADQQTVYRNIFSFVQAASLILENPGRQFLIDSLAKRLVERAIQDLKEALYRPYGEIHIVV